MQKDCTFTPLISNKIAVDSSINISDKLHNDSKDKKERLEKNIENFNKAKFED